MPNHASKIIQLNIIIVTNEVKSKIHIKNHKENK